jgi:hypothetical protein
MIEEPINPNERSYKRRNLIWALILAGVPSASMVVTFSILRRVFYFLLILPGGFLLTMSLLSTIASTFLFLSLWSRRGLLLAMFFLILNGTVLWLFVRELIFPTWPLES